MVVIDRFHCTYNPVASHMYQVRSIVLSDIVQSHIVPTLMPRRQSPDMAHRPFEAVRDKIPCKVHRYIWARLYLSLNKVNERRSNIYIYRPLMSHTHTHTHTHIYISSFLVLNPAQPIRETPVNPYQTWAHENRIISYLGMKSWDLHVCDRASTITHVDRVKKVIPDTTRYDFA